MSRRDITETMAAVFHTDISLRSIPTLEPVESQALTQSVADAQLYVQPPAAMNVDETGWREQAKRTWLWVGATS